MYPLGHTAEMDHLKRGRKPLFLTACVLLGLNFCSPKSQQENLKRIVNLSAQENQLTFGQKGHFLNQRQVFSPNDQWVVFDQRNEDSQIGTNGTIARLHLDTGEIEVLYQVPDQTPFGPGVGAAAYHPQKEEVIFIRGLDNAAQDYPYHFTRRSGFRVSINGQKNEFMHAEARDVSFPISAGALRGGTHAHSYSQDGDWISFTYNDAILEAEALVNPRVKDLRTVGFMIADIPVEVPNSEDSDELFSGSHKAFLAARVTAFPEPGSDEIQKAYEECWLGNINGGAKESPIGTRSMAYLGDVMDANGRLITEIFISEIPQDIANAGLSEGSKILMPEVHHSIIQRRLTYSQNNKYPGVQGPRQWLRSSPDGSSVYYYAKSEDGEVQIFSVSIGNGVSEQITANQFSPDTMFSLSPDGNWLAYGYQQQIYLTHIETSETYLLKPSQVSSHSLSNINWSHSADRLVYNRKVTSPDGDYYQIFELKPFK